jgi:PKHD-type hydroxylase
MKYTTIYNDPYNRSRITHPWSFWDDLFTEEEIQAVLNYCEEQGTERGTTFSGTQEETERVRKSNVKFHARTPETAWIFDKFNFVIQSINEMYYGFELNGYDAFQYTVYNSDEEGKYDWHMDMGMGHMPQNMHDTRKLSLTFLLNDDFEGGEFQINNGMENEPITVDAKKGRCILFPSFMIHRVKPITKGTRRSIVIWVVGPKFT